MTDLEAIKELDTQRNIHLIFAHTKEAEALRLGIKALEEKRTREERGTK